MLKLVVLVFAMVGVYFGLPQVWSGANSTAVTLLKVNWSYCFILTAVMGLLVGFKMQASK
jgi:hypothetical protein